MLAVASAPGMKADITEVGPVGMYDCEVMD